MRKDLFFLFVFLLGLSSCSQDDILSSDGRVPNDSKELCEIEPEGAAQETALCAFDKLMGSFNNNLQSRSYETQEYPTWFGGAYIDSDSRLVVKTTDVNLNIFNGLNNIEVSPCEYSMNEFNILTDKITQLANEGDSFILENVIMYGEDIPSNSYVIGLRDNSEQVRMTFLNKISSSPFIKFVKCSDMRLTSAPLKCASEIANYDKAKPTAATMGYRARKADGTVGIVTVGHFISKGQTLSLRNKTAIGECLDSRNNDGLLDAAFCKITNKDYSPSNEIEFMVDAAKDTLSTDLAQPPTGSIVNMVGYKSKRKSGTIFEASRNVIIDKKQTLADVILMTCVPVEGDSGGIVYALTKSSNKRSTVGINVGSLKIDYSDGSSATYGICCKAYLINRTFNISRY